MKKDGIYYSIIMVKDGQEYAFPPQPLSEAVPAILDAMMNCGVYGAGEVVKRLSVSED